MKLIAITTPDFQQGEDLTICRLIDRGWHRVHIRKPEASGAQISELIEHIPKRYHPHLSLHDHFHLAVEYGLGGVHINARNPLPPAGWMGLASRSCHSIEEVRKNTDLDYLTLSPVFDSISKPGYKSRFSTTELQKINLKKVFALGDVTFSRLNEIEEMGFEGAAMLSEAWKNSMESLQYITHTIAGLEEVLRGGCRWVQLRMKEADDTQFIATAERIAVLCRKYNAILILDDRVHLVERIGADGVHLGKKDMPVGQARMMLGNGKIIGATANTEKDIFDASSAGGDYIGLGPFRFTTTKAGLSPILGLRGYTRTISLCRRQGINLPITAIGGIRMEDLQNLKLTGVDGIALSGMILESENKEQTTKEIIRLWKN